MILTENGKLPAQGYAVYQFGSGPALRVYQSHSTVQFPIPAVIPRRLVVVSPPHSTLHAISLRASTPSSPGAASMEGCRSCSQGDSHGTDSLHFCCISPGKFPHHKKTPFQTNYTFSKPLSCFTHLLLHCTGSTRILLLARSRLFVSLLFHPSLANSQEKYQQDKKAE